MTPLKSQDHLDELAREGTPKRLYNKCTNEYATMLSENDTSYQVQYDDSDQIYTAPKSLFK